MAPQPTPSQVRPALGACCVIHPTLLIAGPRRHAKVLASPEAAPHAIYASNSCHL